MIHVLSIVGARPQFIKLAPIERAMNRRAEISHRTLHTGQHYDAGMSQVFFEGLSIAAPVADLAVGSGTHGVQTGAMMTKLDEWLHHQRPDVVLVYGDTNSTLAGALCAAKLHIPVAHLEAGLRSGNRRMPEEINRIVVDHAADILLAPTDLALENLRREGLGERSYLVGDVMADICLQTLTDAERGSDSSQSDESGAYFVCTIHRAENTDDEVRLRALLGSIAALEDPVILVAHPRLTHMAEKWGISLAVGSVKAVSPLNYKEMIDLMVGSRGLITDSGGLQKEAYFLGVPCTTLRYETEWAETLDDDWNRLSPEPDRIAESVAREVPAARPNLAAYGGGRASENVCDVLIDALSTQQLR